MVVHHHCGEGSQKIVSFDSDLSLYDFAQVVLPVSVSNLEPASMGQPGQTPPDAPGTQVFLTDWEIQPAAGPITYLNEGVLGVRDPGDCEVPGRELGGLHAGK